MFRDTIRSHAADPLNVRVVWYFEFAGRHLDVTTLGLEGTSDDEALQRGSAAYGQVSRSPSTEPGAVHRTAPDRRATKLARVEPGLAPCNQELDYCRCGGNRREQQ